MEDNTIDYAFGNSLFSHLLEEDFIHYLNESYRVLKEGGVLEISLFCLDNMKKYLGKRWTFKHRIGNAYVENIKYPEAAVGYKKEFLEKICKDAGFKTIELLP
ncbi:MAG: class I SAM-dependent methyltransferase [Chlamydiota bacterium]